MKDLISIGLALPSKDEWTADFGLSVTMMCLAIQKHPFAGYRTQGLEIMNMRSSLLPQLRQNLLRDALKHKHTHVLFIDSDQAFPAQLAHMLARHHKPVIGCNIATKNQGNSIPTARAKPGPDEWWGGHQIFSHGKTGIERVWRVGFGVMMIDLSIFKTIPKPWFGTRYLPEPIDDFVGEDWFFCEVMDEHNIPIYVEHEASLLVDHIGSWRYGHDGIKQPAERLKPLLRLAEGGV
jgi:hypothetical protein